MCVRLSFFSFFSCRDCVVCVSIFVCISCLNRNFHHNINVCWVGGAVCKELYGSRSDCLNIDYIGFALD